jgi:hypothetical protein
MASTSSSGIHSRAFAVTIAICLMLGTWLVVLQDTAQVNAQPAAACVQIADAREIPGPKIITFDDLKDGTALNTQYQASYGVTFPNQNPAPVIHAVTVNELDTPQTAPNVAQNPIVVGKPHTPLVISFDFPRTHVGVFLGNGLAQVTADITAKDAQGTTLCTFRVINVAETHTTFAGAYDSAGRIASLSIDYGGTVAESIDNLYLAPGANYGGRRPLPTWTPLPTQVPTQGPAPTATSAVPLFPVYAYHPAVNIGQLLFPPDFGIFNIEITQGIQCFNGAPVGCADNSMPFVLSKSAVARVYVQARDSHSYYNHVPVRLHLLAFGHEYVMDALGNATASINQNTHDAAEFYFTVYSGATSDVGVWAEVDPNHVYSSSYLHNRYPALGYNIYSFANRRTLTVAGQRLYYHPTGYTGSQYAGGWAVNGGAAQWWNEVLPLSDNGINYFVRSGYLDWTANLSSGDAQHALIGYLNLMWIKENALSWWFGTGSLTGARHLYGWAPAQGYSGGHADMPIYPHAGGLGVVGIGSDAPGTNTDNPGSGALIFGHELTHDYNIYHTNTPDACGSNDTNSNFPYSNSSIQAYGFNTLTGKIYNPALTHDLMSYCPSGGSKQGWIAPFTWNAMFNKLSPAVAVRDPAAGAAPSGQTGLPQVAYTQSLVVNVAINHPAPAQPNVYTGTLGTILRVNNTGSLPPVPPGTFAIEEHDAPGGGGTAVYTQTFKVDFTSEYAPAGRIFPPPPFPAQAASLQDTAFTIPWVPGTRSIVLTHDGLVLDKRDVSLNAPQVTITSPIQPVAWPAHTVQPLTWTGTDLDGDPPTYLVFYSNDGGNSFSLLADNLVTTTYNVDVDSMAGGADVRFRVVASDGVNTGFDETPATISIPNRAPVAIITNPANASIHLPGDLIVFHGIGTDMEDGTLPAGSLEWSDNIQGGLGQGQTVPINNLTPGQHVITLKVRDSYNISSTTAVTITVGYPVYLPTLRR